MSSGNWSHDVLTVSRAEMPAIAGLPWKDAKARVGEEFIRHITHGDTRPLAPNHAWLREVDGRAFLYVQNW